MAQETANGPKELPQQGSVAQMRDKWAPHSRFIADLLTYVMSSEHYMHAHGERMQNSARQMTGGSPFAEAVHETCYWDLDALIGMSGFRLQLIATVVADRHPAIQEALDKSYRDFIEAWQPHHAEVLHANGLQLRQGITLDDMGYMLSAVCEGLALRRLAQPAAPVIDHEQDRSLFGTAALALILGCTEKANNPDGKTTEEAAQALVDAARPTGQ